MYEKTNNSSSSHGQALMRIPHIAEYCGVSQRTIKNWIKQDDLPVFYMPGTGTRPIRLIHLEDLKNWLARYRKTQSELDEKPATFTLEAKRFVK